ncbi:MAG TPA: M20/M25/M40 family metallo-hydrolase [Gaiella sp.]|nr:M20/M25/M40 family metallo-hydrolase [Gaiella sp.]
MEQPPLTSRVVDLFVELCAIPSPPGQERAVADRITRELDAIGLEWDEDGCGPAIGSTAGNVLCRLPGNVGGGVPIFLCAHFDTVPLDGDLEPVLDDGTVRNAGGTILGADDKSALAVMVEAARRIVEEGRPHAGVELLFTPMEEIGLVGASAFDATRLQARVGYVYDQAAPIGDVVVGSPTAQELELTFVGRAAHAGMYPEEGRSAILAAARAIVDMPLGRIDEVTSANVGLVRGGSARNVVPERCSLEVEVRSHDEERVTEVVQQIVDAAAFAASLSECSLESRVEQKYRGYRFRDDDIPVRLAVEALAQAGYTARLGLSGGAADANVFNARGLQCVNLANGMTDIHTPDERIAIEDLERMVDVTLALVDAAREAATTFRTGP